MYAIHGSCLHTNQNQMEVHEQMELFQAHHITLSMENMCGILYSFIPTINVLPS